jgi:hypothetical protein
MASIAPTNPMDLDQYQKDRMNQLQTQQLLADDERRQRESQNSWFGFCTIDYWRVP